MDTRRRRVGNYALGGVLGEGSFAKVLLGTHILTGEEVSTIVRGRLLEALACDGMYMQSRIEQQEP